MATTFRTTGTSHHHHHHHHHGRRRSHADRLQTVSFVSATSLGVDAEVRGMARPSVPNYPLRRFVVGTAAAVVAAVALAGAFGALSDLDGAPAAAASSEAATTPSVAASIHVAQPGDTLWSIAEAHRGDVDRDRYIAALVRINGDTGVIAGEAIWLP